MTRAPAESGILHVPVRLIVHSSVLSSSSPRRVVVVIVVVVIVVVKMFLYLHKPVSKDHFERLFRMIVSKDCFKRSF